MVSDRPLIVLKKPERGYFIARHSPLEKTPHKARVIGDGLIAAAGA